MQPLTDEERNKLVANLYSLSRDDDRATLCYDAADEIERLAAELLITRGALERCQGELNLAFERLDLAQSDVPPLRYSNTVEKASDGTETRRLEQSDAEPVRDALREMLVGTRCESIGLEDLEPGCCRVCRARAALYAVPPRPDASAGTELPARPRDYEINFWYKNHRGENAIRFARILGLRWGTSEYHTEPQWLLRAYDYDRHAEREFAVKDMSPITADRAHAPVQREHGMTDEERQKLVADLRRMWPTKTASEAADEIERLAAEVRKLRDELDLVRRDEERFIYD